MRFRLVNILSIAVVLLVAACGGGETSDTTTAIPTTTASSAPTTAASGSTAPFEINGDGEVTIDWAALAGVFFAAPVPSATDPLYYVHNNPATDGFFLGVEAYTTGYGTAWTGEVGTFQIDCSPAGSGICVHFDPDGAGPAGDAGADFLATGTIEILRADFDGFVALLTDVAFTDGTTIPGPLRVTGGNG